MLLIRIENGKPYIGSLEVKLEPVFLGLEVNVGFEKGKAPPLDAVIVNLLSDAYKKGIDLFKANSYRWFPLAQEIIPEITVQDGTVPEQIKRKVIFDFYYSRPVDYVKK